MSRHEPLLQYVVRQIAADLLDQASPPVVVPQYFLELAKQLRDANPPLLEVVIERIEQAREAWSKEHNVVMVPPEGFYWCVKPERVDKPQEGPVVTLRWGFPDAQGCVSMIGEDAFELAQDILALFENEEGVPQRPEFPHEVYQTDPEFEPYFEHFHAVTKELMSKPGFESWASLECVTSWVRSGKPATPIRHEWVEYPDDRVTICSVCGRYYFSDDDGLPSRVCQGAPLGQDDDFPNIHAFDPRRSPELREAQRLDRLAAVMSKCEATNAELEPILAAQQKALSELCDVDRVRYDRERVGLPE